MSAVPNNLAQADEASQQGNWGLARQLYQAILAELPGQPEAERQLRRVSQREAIDAQVQDLIKEADASFRGGAYDQAFQTYGRALNQAAQVGILYHHARLEHQQRQAQELMAWQQRVRQALAAAHSLTARGDWDGAYARLGAELAELPPDDLYKPLAEPLEKARQQAAHALDDGARFLKAKEAFTSQDYEEAIRLAQQVAPTSTMGGQSAKLILHAEHHLQHFIQPHLQVAEAARQAQRWEDAFAALEQLREHYAGSPLWQRHWLEVSMAHGQQALDLGREANTQRKFLAARDYFAAARGAFEKVLEVYPKHGRAPTLRLEAQDLYEVAVLEVQTRTNWDAGERDLAAASLDNALSVIARAQADGRDYTALAAVVGAMRQALTQELERIQAEERRLRDGQRLLTEKRLDEAQAQFRNTLDALLLAVRQAATEGLRTAETNQRLFEEAVRRGQSQLADHPAEAVALLHTAYDYWPYGPQIRGALVEALARAAEATLAADPRAAADYCQRALEFDPDNRRVKALVRYIGVKPTIEAVLEKARLDLNAAAEQPDGAGQFGEIITRLDEALSGAKEFPDLAAQLQTLRQAAQAGLAQWRTTEALYQQANLARGAGDWERLVELLREIVAVVGNGPLAGQTKPAEALKTAQAVAQALRELRPKLVRQVTRAQEAYADAPRTRELRPIVAALDEADQLGQEAQQRATAAEGYLPADLAQLRQQAADLRVTAQEISQALAEPQTSVGLTKLRALRKSGSTDATLEAFVAALEAQGRQAVPALKQQASNALDDGKLNEAVDLLRQAYELQPTDHALETHYAAVVRRKKLEDAVRLAQADAASKLTTNSKVDARNSLRGALDMLLGADLPPEVSAVLYQLFSLAEQDAGWGFGLPEKWSAAQALKDRLTALASGQTNWAFRRVSELATDWATLQRDIGLLGVVSSSAALNDLEPAYRAARTYVVTHPTEAAAIELEAKHREALIAKLVSSARKRLDRAAETVKRGQFSLALENLRSLEADIYAPIQAAHPGLLDNYDAVEQTLQEAEQWRAQAERLEALYSKALPRLEAAEQYFVTNEFSKAEAELAALPVLTGAEELEQRRNSLREGMAQARQAHARHALNDALAGVEVLLRTATTAEHYDPLLRQLTELPRQIDLELLSRDERDRFRRSVEQAREQQEALKAGLDRETEALNAQTQHNYLQAQAALESALAVTRDGHKRAELEQRLEEVRPAALRQQQRAEAETRGRRHFVAHEYAEAVSEFRIAQSLGAETDQMFLAARLGVFLNIAQQAYAREDWESVQLELEDARNLADGDQATGEVAEVLKEINRLQRRLSKRLEQIQTAAHKQQVADEARQARAQAQQAEIQEHLSAAASALALGDLDRAAQQALAVLKLAPRQAEALELQRQVNVHRQAGLKLQAALLARHEGKLGQALAAVQAALKLAPELSEAVALQQEFQDLATLAQAENIAQGGDFQRAKQALQAAADSGLDPVRLVAAQARVQQLETEWQARVLQPIRDDMRDGQYRPAIVKAQAALARAASVEVQAELKVLLTASVNQLAQAQLSALRQRLGAPGQETEVIAELERLAALEPPPAPNLLNEIQDLRRRTHEQQLRARLQAIGVQTTAGERPAALLAIQAIAAEATEHGSPAIFDQANALHDQIEAQLLADQERADQDRRADLLARATAALQAATDRRGLLQAADLANELLKLPQLAADAESAGLVEQIQAALTLFDATEAALKSSRAHLRQRRLAEAEAALRLSPVTPLRQPDFAHQQELVRLWRSAELRQDQQNWELALADLRAVVALDPSLAPLLARDLERCREKLIQAVFAQVRALLESNPRAPESAQALLAQAQRENWLGPDDQNQFRQLQRWIESQTQFAQAIASLADLRADPAPALARLQAARALLPQGQSGVLYEHYEQFGQAIAAFQQRQLEAAATTLARLPADFLERPVVAQFAVELALAQAEAQRQRAVAAQLDQTRQAVEQALNAEAPQVELAIELVHQARALAGAEDERVDKLARLIQDRVGAALDRARQSGHYAAAQVFGRRLRLLPPTEALSRLIEGLPAEQSDRLNAAYVEAEQNLAADQLPLAAQALQRAEIIAGEAADSRLADYRARLQAREATLAEVGHWLQQARTALHSAEWEAAIDALEPARRLAPEYQLVADLVADAQRRLLALAQQDQAAGRYARAVSWCALARRLGSRADLEALEQVIFAARDQRLNELVLQAKRFLQAWQLPAAAGALEQARAIGPNDPEIRRLAEGLARMEALARELAEQLEIGWQALEVRQYAEGRQAFTAARALVPAALPVFHEAEHWANYTDTLIAALHAVEIGSYQAAAEALAAAAAALRPEAAVLPDLRLRPDALALQRRQAVYMAERLRAPVLEMQRLSAESYRQELAGNVESALALTAQLVNQNKPAFYDLHRTRARAPQAAEAVAAPVIRPNTPPAPRPEPAAAEPEAAPQLAVEVDPLPASPADRPALRETTEAPRVADAPISAPATAQETLPVGQPAPVPPAAGPAGRPATRTAAATTTAADLAGSPPAETKVARVATPPPATPRPAQTPDSLSTLPAKPPDAPPASPNYRDLMAGFSAPPLADDEA